MVDESRDCGKHEQISVCVRYVCEGVLKEDFFNFVRAEGLDANSIMNKLKEVLAVMGVCVRDLMIAQCYDGASTMSGCTGGVQALMRQEVCPMALYVHCWAHRLNLVVVACCQDLDKAVSFFDNIQQLYTFFSSTVRHDFFEKTQEVLGKYRGRHRELKALSTTRWCCQSEACSAVAITLGPIIAAVEHFAQDRSADRRVAAQSIVSFIDTDFVICLQLFRKVLTLASYSANYLQDKQMDIGIAIEHIDTLRMSLSKTDLFDEIWDTAKALVDEHEIPQPLEKRRRSCRYDTGNAKVWDKSDYKEKLYEPVISLFIAELDRRFSKESSSVLIAMSALVPTSKDFLSIQVFSPFANHYGLNEELLKCEFTVFSNQYWKKNPQLNTMLDVINFIEPHKVVYI